MSTKEFDPNLYSVTFSAIKLGGWVEDTMIEVEEDGPRFTYKKGLDGDVTRSKSLNVMPLVSVHLMSSSRSNAELTLIHQADVLTDGGAGVAPIFLKDGNGTSIFAHDQSWIEGMPKITKGKEADDNTWKIRVAPGYKWFEGGT